MLDQERGYKQIKQIQKRIEANSRSRFSKKYNTLPKVNYDMSFLDFVKQIKVYKGKTKIALIQQYRRVKKGRKILKHNFDKGIKNTYKLTPLQRVEMIELFSRMFTVSEVHKIINEEWKVPYSLTSVVRFKQVNIEEITRRRNIYINDISKLRLVHKRARLEELMELYDITKEKGWVETGIKVLDQINKEVEKQQLEVIYSGEVNINKAEKINIDIGLENIQTVALLRVLKNLPDEAMKRISNQLIKKQTDLPLLGFGKHIDSSLEISDAVFTNLDSKDNEKVSSQLIKEQSLQQQQTQSQSQQQKEQQQSKLQMLLKKKIEKAKERLYNVKMDVDKLELGIRNENI